MEVCPTDVMHAPAERVWCVVTAPLISWHEPALRLTCVGVFRESPVCGRSTTQKKEVAPWQSDEGDKIPYTGIWKELNDGSARLVPVPGG
jgi:hypothetical protein